MEFVSETIALCRVGCSDNDTGTHEREKGSA